MLTDTEGMNLETALFIVQYKSKNRNKCNSVLNGVAIFLTEFYMAHGLFYFLFHAFSEK